MSGKKYVPEGVYLVCDKGTKISRLKSLFYKETTIFGSNMCTSKDKQFMVNFDTFGTCATCNNCPCTAPVTDWTNVTDQITIDNNTLLLEDSELPCTKGGTIKIFYYKKNALANLPKKKKRFWDFFTEVAEVQRDFSVGFAKGLWKGLKGTVTAVADLAVWAGKHTIIYQMANPAGYAEQLQKDAEMVKKLGNVAKKAGKWVYRNSTINMITDPNDYVLAQAENAEVMDKLIDKAKNMSAEEWGDFGGQLFFEVSLEVATLGGATALTAVKVADKGLDAVKAVKKLEDFSDVANALKDVEKLEEIADGANTVRNLENLDNFKPLELGDVTYQVDEIRTKNQPLKDLNHPVTDVLYKEKIIEYKGKKYRGVFPKFESKFDATLPENLYTKSDYLQFKESTKQLKKQIENTPSLKDNFTQKQLDDIMDEEPYIDDLSWHHKEDVGVMQLVDREIHSKSGHTGGRNIWGGGSESR